MKYIIWLEIMKYDQRFQVTKKLGKSSQLVKIAVT